MKSMIFDTHAHYDDAQFDTDREELLDKMTAGGIGTIVNAGSTLESWDQRDILLSTEPSGSILMKWAP